MAKPHNLPDDLLATQALQERLFHESVFDLAEADRQRGYWFLRQRNNGVFSKRAVGFDPEHAVQRMSQILLNKLNTGLSMGGAWVVAWVNGGDKLICLWLDQDGDAQFTVEADAMDVFHPVPSRRLELEQLVGDCYDAWTQWKRHMIDVLEPRMGREGYRRAMGERPPSERN